jgi:hypothetical protein
MVIQIVHPESHRDRERATDDRHGQHGWPHRGHSRLFATVATHRDGGGCDRDRDNPDRRGRAPQDAGGGHRPTRQRGRDEPQILPTGLAGG